jgi:hypothetical protein
LLSPQFVSPVCFGDWQDLNERTELLLFPRGPVVAVKEGSLSLGVGRGFRGRVWKMEMDPGGTVGKK